MRILYVSTDFGVPVLGAKGASVHVRELADALTDLGHEVVVMTPNVGAGNTTRARVIHVPAPQLPRAVAAALRRLGAPWGRGQQLEREVRELRYNSAFLCATLRLAAEWHPDLVYERYALFGLAGGRLARRLGLPHLLEVNAPLRLERQRGRGLALDGLARWCERRIFGTAGRALCVSRALTAYVIERGGRRERVELQPNAVNAGAFYPVEQDMAMRAHLGFSDEDVVVGFVGSLKPWHGVEHLVEAFTSARLRAPHLRLLIVGDGPRRAELERLVADGGLTGAVRMAGNVAHVDVPHYLAAMDVTAAPYLDAPDFYFSPLKVFEYMAAGRPVIAPHVGQIPELVQHGRTGLLYPPEDTTELAERLVTLAQQPDLRRRLGARAAEEVRAQHTWQAIARRVVALAAAEHSGAEQTH